MPPGGQLTDELHTDFPLLRAPDAWLQLLLTAATPRTKLALLQSCKTLKGMLLQSQEVKLTISLDNPIMEADEVCRQQVILQQATKVRLHAHQEGFSNDDTTMFLSRLLMYHMGRPGGPLHNITRVELRRVYLSEVVPSCLVVACPTMKLLALRECHFIQGRQQLPPAPICHQLQSLQLFSPVSLCAPVVQHAASALPNLHTLHIDLVWDDNMWHVLLPLSTHLKKLSACLQAPVCQLAPLQQFTCITDIGLLDSTVDDDAMEVLLNLPNLVTVYVCNLQLASSFQHRACSWKCLHVSGACGISSLAYLPVAGIGRLETGLIEIDYEATQESVAAAVVNMSRCPQWHAFSHELIISPLDDDNDDDDLLCMTALPMLQHIKGCRRLAFEGVQTISASLVDRLARHIPLCCTSLKFTLCTWERGACELVRSTIPRFVEEISTGEAFTCPILSLLPY